MPLLAQLVVEYVADVSKLTSGVQQAANSMKSVNQSAEGGAAALRNFAAGAAVLAATAIIGIGVASTKMAADFQEGMTSLETGAGESAKNIKQVSDGILALAPATATTTKELTDGMFMIESAGFHGADGLNVLKNAAEGARVGNAALKDVANGVTTALVDYNLSADQSASVTNDLIATVANGKTTMGQLSSSLKSILPVASSAGISLRDVSGAMSTMTGEGVPAGQSATYLKTMILALEAPSTKGAAALANIGLSAQKVSDAMKVSLPSALELVTSHLKTKFPEGSAAYTKALKDITGGSSALSAVLDLTGSHMDVLRGNVKNISDAVKNGGSSITGWSKVQQNFNFQMDKGREVVETLGIKLGTALLPKVGELLAKIMPTVTQFGNWLISSHALENGFSVLSNAIGGVISVVSNVVGFFQHNQAAFEALKIATIILAGVIGGALVASMIMATVAAWNMAIAFLANPITWIAIAIGVAIALIVIAIMHWGDIVKWLSGIWGAFSSWFMGILGAIGAFFVGLWQNLANWFIGMWTGIVTGLQAAWAFIINIVKVAIMVVLAVLFGPILIIAALFIWLYQHNTYFKMLVDAIVGFFVGCFNWCKDNWQGFINFLGGVWNGLVGIARNVWNQVAGAVKTAFSAAIGFVVWVWGAISSTFSSAWNNYIAGPLASLWTTVSTFFSGVWSNYVAGPIGSLWNSLSSTISGWASNALKWGENLIQGFIDGIRNKIGEIGSALADTAKKISDFLGFHSPTKLGPGSKSDTWAPNFVKMYAKGLNDGIPQIEDAVSNFMKPIAFNIKGVNPNKALSILGAPTNLGANTNVTPLQGGNDKQEVHVHVHTYWDGHDITDRVMTKAVEASRGGPIR